MNTFLKSLRGFGGGFGTSMYIAAFEPILGGGASKPNRFITRTMTDPPRGIQTLAATVPTLTRHAPAIPQYTVLSGACRDGTRARTPVRSRRRGLAMAEPDEVSHDILLIIATALFILFATGLAGPPTVPIIMPPA
ncbi:MAG: hypothetical protein ACM3X6_00650 [Patescibacteria group bacterium]